MVPGSKAQQGGGDAAAADGGRWGALRTGESIMTELEFTTGTAPINIEDGSLLPPPFHTACILDVLKSTLARLT